MMSWRTATYSGRSSCVEAASWRTATYSSLYECVEAASWRRASGCDGGTCVEAGHGSGVVGVRDTTQAGDPARTVIEFSAGAWAAFTATLRA
jgi:hypothetical protein